MNSVERTSESGHGSHDPVRRPTAVARHDAGAPGQRQAVPPTRRLARWRLLPASLALTAAALSADPAARAATATLLRAPPAAEVMHAADDSALARQRRLQDDRRAIDGRIQGLDRQLDLHQSDQLRAPPPVPGGVRGYGDPDDPVLRRQDQERRDLQDQRRMIDDRLRWEGR